MTTRAERVVLSAEQRLAGGSRAVPLTVMFFLLLDIVTTVIGQAYGMPDLGPEGALPTFQNFLVAAAVAATMWNRPRAAMILTGVVVTLVFTVGPSGLELWLVLVVAVTVATRASGRQIALTAPGLLAYAVCYGFLLERRRPGWGWDAGLITVIAAGLALVVGLVARRLLRARDRARGRVQELEREQTEIRGIERARLAKELRTIVIQGLAAIECELDRLERRSSDLDSLRSGLARIDLRSRSLLTELRVLLEVLRRDPRTGAGPSAALVGGRGTRRWVDLLSARHVRFAITAVFGLLALRVAVTAPASLTDGRTWVLVIGLLACGVAVWQPLAGAGAAGLALALSTALDPSGYWAALPAALLCLLGAYHSGSRRIWLVVLALAGCSALLALTDSDDPRSHVVLVCYVGFLAIAVGLTARHFVAERAASLAQLIDLTNQRERVEAEERSAVARELHDVVAHQLSVTAMLVMATSMSTDRCLLAETVDRVRHSTEAAQHELSTLLDAMRGPEVDQLRPAPLITPLASARALTLRLSESGYRAVLHIDPAADALDMTTQRTLARIMQEAATNILRYTPAGSTCHFTLTIDTGGVRLGITSPMAATERRSDLSLGWGLRGIRERVELTLGTFTAGPDHGEWVLDVTLPAAATAEALPVASLT